MSLKGDVRRLLADANVEQLKKLGRVLGNDAVAGKLGRNDQLRDLLLDVVRERLQAIELAQKAELKALRDRAPWWRKLQRGQRGITMPEPTRWAEPARLFRQAGEAICAGDLGRGADLLKQATESERTHRKAMPAQVPMPRETTPAVGVPPVIGEVHDGEGCTPISAPDIQATADRIENVTESHADATHLPNARHQGTWWELEVDEEAEKKLRENPRSSKRLLEPAAQADLARRPERASEKGPTAVREVRTEVVAPEQARVPEREARAAESVEKAPESPGRAEEGTAKAAKPKPRPKR